MWQTLRSKFPWFIDCSQFIILLILLFTVFKFQTSEEANNWQNPFQNLPWDQCLKLEFTKENFEIRLDQPKPQLQLKSDAWIVEPSKLQKFLDNWLILPEFNTLSKSTDSDYGFGLKADLKFHFNDQNVSIFLGRSVPGMSGSFYVSTSSQTIFTLPTALRRNLLWPMEQFLPRNPIPENPTEIVLPTKIMGSKISLHIENEHWISKNQKKFHQPEKVVNRLTQIKLDPTTSIGSLGNLITSIQINDKSIHIHEDGFIDLNRKLAWPHSKASRQWILNLPLEFMSTNLKDHEPLIEQTIQRLEYSNGKTIDPKNSMFSFYLKKLRHFEGEVVRNAPNIAMQPFTIQCILEGQVLTLSGLKSKNLIMFSIINGLYLTGHRKSILP